MKKWLELFRPKSQDIVAGFDVTPHGKYVFVFNKTYVSREVIEQCMERLHRQGVDAIMIAGYGPPDALAAALKIVGDKLEVPGVRGKWEAHQ